ncbi:MAG TPA: hypothetical protein GXX51_11080 [Firmicutes bacterium]|nr:hypothetical protein [Bacillota bacterium]
MQGPSSRHGSSKHGAYVKRDVYIRLYYEDNSTDSLESLQDPQGFQGHKGERVSRFHQGSRL